MSLRKVWPRSINLLLPGHPKKRLNMIATLYVDIPGFTEHVRIAIDLEDGAWFVEDPWRAGVWKYWGMKPPEIEKNFAERYFNITGYSWLGMRAKKNGDIQYAKLK